MGPVSRVMESLNTTGSSQGDQDEHMQCAAKAYTPIFTFYYALCFILDYVLQK